MNKVKYIMMIIIIISLSFGVVFIFSATAFPENPSTHAYFDKICEMNNTTTIGPQSPEHFWQYGGDCDDRALAFQEYLNRSRATNVQICWVCYKNENGTMVFPPIKGGMGHVFILWNNKVYSPNLNESNRFYNSNIETYKLFLKETYGYNTWYFENETVGSPF